MGEFFLNLIFLILLLGVMVKLLISVIKPLIRQKMTDI